MPDWLAAYHSFPYPLRVAAASLHGLRLRTIRYSSSTDRWVAEVLARESWTPKQWHDWQQERLARMLWHATRKVPYYRQQWEARRRRGDGSSVELLENWPILSKESVREKPQAFVADGVKLGEQVVEHTSGTTGKPLTLWMSIDAVRQWYAHFEARWRGWYGLSRRDRWGILGGQMVTPYKQKMPPFWVWNLGLNQLYLSSYHLAPANIAAYLRAIRDHGLIYLLGYASALFSLAQSALEQGLDIPALKAVISNAEPLYAHQKEIISQAFQCAVHDTYGLSENVCAASECGEGNLHLWPDVGAAEIFRDDSNEPAPPGEVGRLVCTGLLNRTMPLIRYMVGDRAATSDQPCRCGRAMPILQCIEGRIDDVVLTADGRRVGRLDSIFKSEMPIREAQIIQQELDQFQVRIVPAIGYDSTVGQVIAERLCNRVGNVDVSIEIVSSIPHCTNGKFRAVISQLERISP
jgi:phenylacetate-CoA ligase